MKTLLRLEEFALSIEKSDNSYIVVNEECYYPGQPVKRYKYNDLDGAIRHVASELLRTEERAYDPSELPVDLHTALNLMCHIPYRREHTLTLLYYVLRDIAATNERYS